LDPHTEGRRRESGERGFELVLAVRKTVEGEGSVGGGGRTALVRSRERHTCACERRARGIEHAAGDAPGLRAGRESGSQRPDDDECDAQAPSHWSSLEKRV